MVNNCLNIIQQFLFPPSCLFCGDSGVQTMDICQDCFDELPENTPNCLRCARSFEPTQENQVICGQCLQQPPHFDQVIAPYLYLEYMAWLITGLKFRKQYKHARLLAQLLAGHVSQLPDRPDYILPVPLHPSRYRQRGFNQSQEIARTLSRQLNIPLHTDCCKRILNTPRQSQLPAKQRRKNVRRAFAVTHPVHGQHIAVLDDVMTTGSTAGELARILKQAGASRVDIWVCARA